MGLLHTLVSAVSRRVLRPMTARRVYTIRHGLAAGFRTRGGLDFIPRPSTPEARFIQSLSLAGKTIYDIGAFEGMFTLYFPRAVGDGRVEAFEPNPHNRAKLEENLQLNGIQNVAVHELAVAREAGIMCLDVPPGEPTMGRLRAQSQAAGQGFAVDTTPLDALVFKRDLPPPDFIKLDVEGAELEVLRGAEETIRRHGPEWFIELHRTDEPEAFGRAVAALLAERGYTIYHVEQRRERLPEDKTAPFQGHLYCRKN